MSDEELREIIEAAPLIRQMLAGAEEEALRRFEAGMPVAGLKAVNGRGSRAWAFPEEEMADKLKRMGIPKDVLWKTTLISPAQAEKASLGEDQGWREGVGPVVAAPTQNSGNGVH